MNGEGRKLLCPGCSQMIPVLASARPGDLIECGYCARVRFRLFGEVGREFLKRVQLATCPVCGEPLPVDDDIPEGAVVEHDGRRFGLHREFEAFSLEPVERFP